MKVNEQIFPLELLCYHWVMGRELHGYDITNKEFLMSWKFLDVHPGVLCLSPLLCICLRLPSLLCTYLFFYGWKQQRWQQCHCIYPRSQHVADCPSPADTLAQLVRMQTSQITAYALPLCFPSIIQKRSGRFISNCRKQQTFSVLCKALHW